MVVLDWSLSLELLALVSGRAMGASRRPGAMQAVAPARAPSRACPVGLVASDWG